MGRDPVNVLSLCSGAGALDLGIRSALGDARVVCHVERESFAAEVLASRMEEGALDPAPVWTDLATFDGRPWRGVVDLVSAGFPCQPYSRAGKRLKTEDERWIWDDIVRILRDVGPSVVVLENPTGLFDGGLEIVLGGLAALGFDAVWDVYSAAECGAPHERERVFVLAHAVGARREGGGGGVSGIFPEQFWPTPTVKGNNNQAGASAKSGDGLSTAARQWPTPTAQDYGSNRGGACGRVGEIRPSLSTISRTWATPTASISKGGAPQDSKGKRDLRLDMLAWATPTVGNTHGNACNRDTWRPSLGGATRGLGAQRGRPDETTKKAGPTSDKTTQAPNPRFVEWLMNWPRDWTRIDCGSSETGVSLPKSRSRSGRSRRGSAKKKTEE